MIKITTRKKCVLMERCDGLPVETLVERIALKSDDFCGDDFQLKALARGV